MATGSRHSPETFALIVGAGEGRRFGRSKAFYPWRGEPLMAWAARPFVQSPEIDGLVLVAREEDLEQAQALARGLGKPARAVAGGPTRSASVRRGLAGLPPGAARVAVHDAARPLCSPALLARLLAAEGDCVIPRLPLHDALHRDPASGGGPVAREGLWRVQTPQLFSRALLEQAHAGGGEAADDGALALALGAAATYVDGEEDNIKVTTPEDIGRLERLLGPPRAGHGYDVHRLVQGRRLVLGGVEIPSELGALGHSDADVLCHALMDAVLGAAGLPDIGHYFPPDDPAYQDADSLALLQEVCRLARSEGFVVGNADCTLLLERPKVAPHRERMLERIAGALSIESSRVSVKATTSEGVGPVGLGQAVAAWAVVTLLPVQSGR